MKTEAKVPSKYGPVTVPLIRCDQCDTAAQVDYAMGWLQVFQISQLRTMGSLPDESHYCSSTCLKTYMGEH
jgi:hypothetical protein